MVPNDAEKVLWMVTGLWRDGFASPTVRLREEQLRREEEKLRDIELKVQREISEKEAGALCQRRSTAQSRSQAVNVFKWSKSIN